MIVLDRTNLIKHSFSSSFSPQTRRFQNSLLSDTFCHKGFPRSMSHSFYGFLTTNLPGFFVSLAFVSGFSPYILLISSPKLLLSTLIHLLKSIVESLMYQDCIRHWGWVLLLYKLWAGEAVQLYGTVAYQK